MRAIKLIDILASIFLTLVLYRQVDSMHLAPIDLFLCCVFWCLVLKYMDSRPLGAVAYRLAALAFLTAVVVALYSALNGGYFVAIRLGTFIIAHRLVQTVVALKAGRTAH